MKNGFSHRKVYFPKNGKVFPKNGKSFSIKALLQVMLLYDTCVAWRAGKGAMQIMPLHLACRLKGGRCGLSGHYASSLRFSWRSGTPEIPLQPSEARELRNFSGASRRKSFELVSGSSSRACPRKQSLFLVGRPNGTYK